MRHEFYASSVAWIKTGRIHVSVQRRDKSLPSQRYQTALCYVRTAEGKPRFDHRFPSTGWIFIIWLRPPQKYPYRMEPTSLTQKWKIFSVFFHLKGESLKHHGGNYTCEFKETELQIWHVICIELILHFFFFSAFTTLRLWVSFITGRTLTSSVTLTSRRPTEEKVETNGSQST